MKQFGWESLYLDDIADACIFLMKRYNYKDIEEIINLGVWKDIKLKDLALLIRNIVDFEGEIKYDLSRPDGRSRKLLKVSRMNPLAWKPKISMEDGIKRSYEWYSKIWME
jgi:GDP-L-fucose synthase